MQETVKQRLVRYLECKKIGRNKFEMMAGMSQGYITNLKNAPKEQQLVKILQSAPDLNRVWLLTGEGDMLVSPSKADNCKAEIAKGEGISAAIVRMMNERQIAPYGMLADKDREIAELNRQIGRLEAQLEEAKRGTVRRECDAAVANAG